MPTIDCLGEIEINAQLSVVFDVVSNYPGWNQWIPIYNCTLLDSKSIEVGAKVLHQYGYKPIIFSNFVRSIDAIVRNQSMEESYIEGDLIGKGVWRFEARNNKTIASYHCMVKSNTLFTHLSFLLMGKMAHRNIYKPLLKKLKSHCESLI